MSAPRAIDTGILLRDLNDPNNAYLPPAYPSYDGGYWPDDEPSFYTGTFFDQIVMYGQLDPQEQLHQAEVEEIIERMGADDGGDTTSVNDMDLPKGMGVSGQRPRLLGRTDPRVFSPGNPLCLDHLDQRDPSHAAYLDPPPRTHFFRQQEAVITFNASPSDCVARGSHRLLYERS